MHRAPHHHDWVFYIGLNLALACLIAAAIWLSSNM